MDISQTRQWVQVDMSRGHLAPPHFPFTVIPAIHFEVEEDDGLLQFLTLFLDDALVGIMVDETNRYTDQSQQKQPGTVKH